MPHFIIECSESILNETDPVQLMQAVYEEADSTGLFAENDIKVRIAPYKYVQLGEGKKDFLHVFGWIMEGRTVAQKADLSRRIITRLSGMMPAVSFVAMNVNDFEKATYCNRALIDPGNINGDRHFNR